LFLPAFSPSLSDSPRPLTMYWLMTDVARSNVELTDDDDGGDDDEEEEDVLNARKANSPPPS